MKKAVSICLTALLLLNVMGYYGVFLGLKYRNAVRVSNRIEALDYLESETITIKIPLSIPYYGNTGFEKVDGEIEHKGQFFRLVKQKLEKDTLHVVCIRDTRAKVIHEALTDYVNTFADQSSEQPHTRPIQPFLKDFFASTFRMQEVASGWSMVQSHHVSHEELLDSWQTHVTPPPRG